MYMALNKLFKEKQSLCQIEHLCCLDADFRMSGSHCDNGCKEFRLYQLIEHDPDNGCLLSA